LARAVITIDEDNLVTGIVGWAQDCPACGEQVISKPEDKTCTCLKCGNSFPAEDAEGNIRETKEAVEQRGEETKND